MNKFEGNMPIPELRNRNDGLCVLSCAHARNFTSITMSYYGENTTLYPSHVSFCENPGDTTYCPTCVEVDKEIFECRSEKVCP